MLKFGGKDEKGKPLFGFGLSEENVRRIKDDQPIVVDMAKLNRPDLGTILIFYGKTEEELAKSITPFMGNATIYKT